MFSYPSSSELRAQKAQAGNGLLRFEEALALPLGDSARHGVKALALRVPDALRGLFRVQLVDGELTALQILPDAPSEAMASLLSRIGTPNTFHQHGAHFQLRYADEELQALIDTPPLAPARALESVHAHVMRNGYDAKRSYQHDGRSFVGSFRLSDVLAVRRLPQTEKNIAKRIAHAVGYDLTDAFSVQLVQQDGKPQIASISVAPNLIGQELMDHILRPVQRAMPGAQRSLRSVGMRQHGSTQMIEREQLLAIDKTLRDTAGASRA